jgi:hypothetical protein
MEEIIKNVKTSTMFTEIEHLIKEMIENIGKIRQNRETNSSFVKEQKRIIENEIQELRTKINNHHDKLQQDLMKEMTEAVKQETEETHELLVSLDEKQRKLTEYQTNIVNIKRYASDLQTCLALKQIEKDVETQDTCLQSIVNSCSLNQTKLSYKIDTDLKTITTSIQKFGEVVVESKPCEIKLFRKKEKQVELFQKGKDKTGSCTYDTVFIKDNNSVAVSSRDGNKRCIAMIGIESNEIITPIFMDTNIYGMAVRGRTIYYRTRNKGLKMLNLSDKSLSDCIGSCKSN